MVAAVKITVICEVLVHSTDGSDYIETGICRCKITSAVDLPLFKFCGKHFFTLILQR